jgi:hypothetical protein
MRRLQTLRDLSPNLERVFERQRPFGDAVFQRLALEEGHCKEGLAVGVINLVDRADVGVMERGGGLSFAQEALLRLGVTEQVSAEEFQRHLSAQLRVLNPIDHAHPALAELLDDPVMADGLADHDCSILPRAG